MKKYELNSADFELVTKARELINLRKKKDYHAVSSVLRTKAGKVSFGLHLEAYVGRIAVCAEAIAIGNAAINGDTEIDTIVAVYHTGDIVAPCGMCRELIFDYSPDTMVILEEEKQVFKISVKDLIPMKYERKQG